MAQPSSGGAVQTIGGIAKSLAPEPWVARPGPNLADAERHEMELVCRLSAMDLTENCSGTFTCGSGLEVPCLNAEPMGLGGIDFVAAGTGLRNSSKGAIALRGAPPESKPVVAWLYWGAILSAKDVATSGWIEFDGKTIAGELIGTSKQPCWKADSVFASWRADVSDFIEPHVNGNYEVEISGDTSQQVIDGRDPWNPVDKVTPTRYNGASLVVVYWSEDLPSSSWFFLHQGPELLIGGVSFRQPLDWSTEERHLFQSSVQNARQLRLGGDGQTYGERQQPVAPFSTFIGGEGGDWYELRGPNSSVDLHADWQGSDGGSSQLWDTQTTSFPASMLGWGEDLVAYWLRYEPQKRAGDDLLYDCVEVVAHALSLH